MGARAAVRPVLLLGNKAESAAEFQPGRCSFVGLPLVLTPPHPTSPACPPLATQEGLDIDVLVHGEAERTDMSEHFGERVEWRYPPRKRFEPVQQLVQIFRLQPCSESPHPAPIPHVRCPAGMQLSGMVFTQHGWVQSYGSRYVRPPIIAGDVAFVNAMTVREFKVAQVCGHGDGGRAIIKEAWRPVHCLECWAGHAQPFRYARCCTAAPNPTLGSLVSSLHTSVLSFSRYPALRLAPHVCRRHQDLTPRPVKGMLTGPVTILNWSFPRKDLSRRAQAFQVGGGLGRGASIGDIE
jgi:hypothetical protein